MRETEILKIDSKNNRILFFSYHLCYILKKIYDYVFLNVPEYFGEMKDIIKSMELKGHFSFRSTLLSKQEASYFNYFLNSSEFGNSMELRNKYSHGASGTRGVVNQKDYYSFLRILILLTIKIENDIQQSLGKH